jgi:hypothetical protein
VIESGQIDTRREEVGRVIRLERDAIEAYRSPTLVQAALKLDQSLCNRPGVRASRPEAAAAGRAVP